MAPEEQAVTYLLDAYDALALNNEDKKRLRKARLDMLREGASDRNISRMIAAKILDGLAYGNW